MKRFIHPRTYLFLFASTLIASAYSTPVVKSNFPRGCEVIGYGYQQNHLILNDTGKQTLYLIQNRGSHPIELEHVTSTEVFMAPKLEAQILPGYWAAFASDEANNHFKCLEHINDQSHETNCAQLLDICQYPRVKFALSNQGNYWISTNKPQAQVIKEAATKGIYLKW
jgi:hypothetical protein